METALQDVKKAEPSVAVKTILFACTQNAGRSQMAAAFFNAMSNSGLARAISAGTRPAERVHPEVVVAMQEAGLDLSRARPQLLTPALASQAKVLVTMGCGEECPLVPGVRRVEWTISDPHGQTIERVRAIRDEIRDSVWHLIATEGCWKLRPVSVRR